MDVDGAVKSHDEERVLVVNTGSSSVKIALCSVDGEGVRDMARGAAEGIGQAGARGWLEVTPNGDHARRDTLRLTDGAHCKDHRAALDALFELLDHARLPPATCIGHRVVHGGDRFVSPCRLDDETRRALASLVPLAPLHLPPSLAGIDATFARLPELPEVACFDTAFHASMPDVAKLVPLPEALGLRRFGFHGLSYEHAMSTLGSEIPPRIVLAHLGNGASLVAVLHGRAIDTTMGFTPAGGIPMGTRSGDLDPGVLVHLARERGMSADAIERIVEHEAGLLAIGGSADMKTLLARAQDDERAAKAVRAFTYAIEKTVGAFAVALGGLDLLVFTGGIGEHAAPVRRSVCTALHVFGVDLDHEQNDRDAKIITKGGSRCEVRVVQAREDHVIACHTRRVLRSDAPRTSMSASITTS